MTPTAVGGSSSSTPEERRVRRDAEIAEVHREEDKFKAKQARQDSRPVRTAAAELMRALAHHRKRHGG